MKKRVLLAAALTAAMTTSLAGCSSSSENSQPAPTQAASGETSAPADAQPASLDTITMMVNYKATEAPADDNPIIVGIEEHTGVDVDINWVPQDAYSEKVNTLMASKQLPMISVIREVKSSGVVNAARAGMFWDVAPYIDQFENLSKIDPIIWKNVQTDGKQFMIPRIRQTARQGVMLRTDWLENLGMEMPTTIDELHNVLYAFTYNDPDGNGVDDTIGLTMSDSDLKKAATQFAVYSGGINEWSANEDGTFTSQYETQEYTDSLTMFRTWFEEGLINKDFPVNKDELTNFTNGYAGAMIMGNIEDASSRLTNLNAINPEATIDVLQILTKEPGGEERLMGYQGFNGAMVIPTTSVKTEEELLAVLSFLDKLGDPEICDMFNYGIEGESYTLADGGISQNEEQQLVYASRYNQIRQMTPFYTFQNLVPTEQTEIAKHVTKLMTENEAKTIPNPAVPFISDTDVNSGGELTVFIEDAATNYVIGETSLEEYQKAVSDWLDNGARQIGEEYAAQYNAQ